mgnify:CR=1 FL=1
MPVGFDLSTWLVVGVEPCAMGVADQDDGEPAGHRFLVAGPLVLDREDHRAWLDGEPLLLGGKALSLLQELMLRSHTLVTNCLLYTSPSPRDS